MTRTIIYINNLLTRGGHVNSYNKVKEINHSKYLVDTRIFYCDFIMHYKKIFVSILFIT